MVFLEKKLGKEDYLSGYERWRTREMKRRREESRRFDKELFEKRDLVFTKRGVMKREEAEKRDLEKVELP